MTQKIDDSRVKTLTKMGFSARMIAAELHIHADSVSRSRKRSGIALTRPAAMTPEQVQRMDEMLEDGVSYAEIARTFGFHQSSIARRLPNRGWTAQQAGELGAMNRGFKL